MLRAFCNGLTVGVGVLTLALGTAAAPAARAQDGAPAALVEAIDAASLPDLGVMDYVYEGMQLDLGDGGTMTLSYLRSCRVERISGGVVTVGARRSQVISQLPVEVEEVECDGGGIVPTDRQREDAAGIAFRSLNVPDTQEDRSGAPGTSTRPDPVVVYSTAPVFLLSDSAPQLTIARTDPGWEETVTFNVDRKRLDLSETRIRLQPGGRYLASTRSKSVPFTIAPRARAVVGTVVERLIGL